MKNSEYWLKRAQQLEDAQTKKNTEYFGGELERIYQKAIRDTEKDIAGWYTRFAKNNGITMAEAKKLLNSRELKEFKWTVEEYIDYGKKNAVSGEWMKQLENASARYHISRLEALKLQMQNHVEVLMGSQADGVTDLMRGHLEDGYYRTAFEIQKFMGVGTSFSRLDEDMIEKALSKPWAPDGRDFSSRIWGEYRPHLVNELHKTLSQAIIKGQNPKVVAKGFAKYVSDEAAKSYRSKQSRAENLVMTETAFFRSEGQRRCYKELGVDEFENCATLDSKTSQTCRDMDGTHFPVSDMQPGVTCPPFHNRCRTATCPYFDDEFTVGEVRAARAADGSYYTVPADMTYREWEKSFVSDENGLQSGRKSGIINESGISGKSKTATSSNTVDIEYIHSDEYRAKFNGLPYSEAVNETVYTFAKAALTHRSKTNREDMYLIDLRDGSIAGRQVSSSEEFAVEYNDSLNNAIKNMPKNTLISLHNHPTDNPPTGSDFASLGYHGYHSGVVVCHNGKVYWYKAGNDRLTSRLIDMRIEKARRQFSTLSDEDIHKMVLNELSNEYDIEWGEL